MSECKVHHSSYWIMDDSGGYYNEVCRRCESIIQQKPVIAKITKKRYEWQSGRLIAWEPGPRAPKAKEIMGRLACLNLMNGASYMAVGAFHLGERAWRKRLSP